MHKMRTKEGWGETEVGEGGVWGEIYINKWKQGVSYRSKWRKPKGRQPGMDRSMPSTERETTAARLIILMGMPGLEVRESEGCLLVICWLVTLIIGWCRRCFVTPEQWVLYLHFPRLKNGTLITAWKLLPHKLHPNISIISLRLGC